MCRVQTLALTLLTVAAGWAAPPLQVQAEIRDGWPMLDAPDGPTGEVLPGQLRRVEVSLTNPGPDVVVLQSVEPAAGLIAWFEFPFGSVTRHGDEATLDRTTRSHTHGGSMLTMAVWPNEQRRITVAARLTTDVLRLTTNFYAVGLDALAQQFYVADDDPEETLPRVYRRRAADWLREERPVMGLWFHHDLDIEQGWPLLAGERTDVPESKYPRQKLVAEFGVSVAPRPAGVSPDAIYSNALSGYVELRSDRRAQLAADPRPFRLASLSVEALDVLDSAPGPYPLRLGTAGSPTPAGLPDGVVVIDEAGWQTAIVPETRLAAMLGWLGSAGRAVTVREAYFDERPVYALP